MASISAPLNLDVSENALSSEFRSIILDSPTSSSAKSDSPRSARLPPRRTVSCFLLGRSENSLDVHKPTPIRAKRRLRSSAGADDSVAGPLSRTKSDVRSHPYPSAKPATPGGRCPGIPDHQHKLPRVAFVDGVHMVSCETAAALIRGLYANEFDKICIIDCRYEYEHKGGRIKDSINVTQPEDIENFFNGVQETCTRTVFIFHCEFSKNRGPRACKYMRSLDRKIHDLNFPNLYFPELYVMQGGYKRFFELYPELCLPSSYVSMTDSRFLEEHKISSKLWKKKSGDLSPFPGKCSSPPLFFPPGSFPASFVSSSVSSSRASTPSESQSASPVHLPVSPLMRSSLSFSALPSPRPSSSLSMLPSPRPSSSLSMLPSPRPSSSLSLTALPSPLTLSSSSSLAASPLTRSSSSSSSVPSPLTRSSSALSDRRHDVESPEFMFDPPSPSPQPLDASSSPEFLAFRRDPSEALGLPEFSSSTSRRRPNIRPLDLNNIDRNINRPRARRICFEESDSCSLSLPVLPSLPADPIFGPSGDDS